MQRCWKNKNNRLKWPSMDMLRALFLDQKAIEAGAADSHWYQPAALAIREALRRAPEVEEALDECWAACTSATGSPGGLSSAPNFTCDDAQFKQG